LYYGSEIGMSGDKIKELPSRFPGWLGDENAFTKEGRTFIQNQYFDFTSKCSGEKPTKRYILEK
jgi:hypothetical protein